MDNFNNLIDTSNKENEFKSNLNYKTQINKSELKRSVSYSKKDSKLKSSNYNFDFSKEKEDAKEKANQEFSEITNDYEILQFLGKGSYGIVAKVNKN